MYRTRDLFRSRRNLMEDTLPFYYKHSVSRRNFISLTRLFRSRKCIHIIPVIVILCVLILWWYSYPVILEMKDGRIKDVHRIIKVEPDQSLNETITSRVDLTILAMATANATVSAPPFMAISQRYEQVDNETAAEPVMSNYKKLG